MKGNLILLGALCLVSMVAAAGVAASASASYVLTPGANPAILTGSQIGGKATNVLEITSRGTKVECEGASYIGTTEGTEVTEVKVHPTYTGCAAFGIAATIDTKGCDLLLTGETDAEKHGRVHVICNVGHVIEITIPTISCTLKIHEQTPTEGGLTYRNVVVGPSDVEATASIKGITYERVGNGVLCAAGAPSEGNDTDLSTKVTVKSFEDKGCTGNLTEETLSCSEGSQVGLVVQGEKTAFGVLTAHQIAHEAGDLLKAANAEVSCEEVTLSGTSEEANPVSMTLHPEFSGCEASEQPATIDAKGCDLLLTTEVEEGKQAPVHVVCESGKAIEVTIPTINCTIKIHEQTATAGGFAYTNTGGSPKEVEATASIEGITYERVGTGTLCKLLLPSSEANDASLLQNLTIAAYEDLGTEGFGTLTSGELTFKEGNQKDLEVPVISARRVLTAHQIAHEAGNVLKAANAEVSCEEVTLSGTSEEAKPVSMTLHPKYSGCEAAELAATIDAKGCDLLLTTEAEEGKQAPVHVVCESGKAIEVTIPTINCTIKIHEQTATAGGFSYTNTGGSPKEVEATASIEGITYERVGTGTLCKLLLPSSEANDASLLQNLTIAAYEDLGTEGAGTLTNEGLTFKEGNQKDLEVG
jgi:hypothetical protein